MSLSCSRADDLDHRWNGRGKSMFLSSNLYDAA